MPASSEGFWQGLAAYWWDRLPQRLGRPVPAAGAVLSDGYYLKRWPQVAALAGPVVGAFGLLVALLVRWSPAALGRGQAPDLYSHYLWFVLLAAVVGMLGRHLGAWLCAGYVVPDFVLHLVDPRLGLTRLYADMLLILLCLVLGLRAAQLAELLAPLLPETYKERIAPRWMGTACAFFVTLLWANAFPILVRPTYVWISTSLRIPTTVIQPVQAHVLLIALAAALAAAVRFTYEPWGPQPPEHYVAAPPSWLRRVVPPGTWQASIVQAAVTTLLLAGMMGTWVDAFAYGAFMTVFYGAQSGLVPWLRLPGSLADRLARVPPGTRLLVAVGGSIVLAWVLMAIIWNHLQTFRPLLIVIACLLLVFQLLSSVRATAEEGVQTT